MGIGVQETYMVYAFPLEWKWGVKPCKHMIWHPSASGGGLIDATCEVDDFMCRHCEFFRVHMPEKFEKECHRVTWNSEVKYEEMENE
jgi:hypothetical protein